MAFECGTIAQAVLTQPALLMQSLSLQPLNAVLLARHVTRGIFLQTGCRSWRGEGWQTQAE